MITEVLKMTDFPKKFYAAGREFTTVEKSVPAPAQSCFVESPSWTFSASD